MGRMKGYMIQLCSTVIVDKIGDCFEAGLIKAMVPKGPFTLAWAIFGHKLGSEPFTSPTRPRKSMPLHATIHLAVVWIKLHTALVSPMLLSPHEGRREGLDGRLRSADGDWHLTDGGWRLVDGS